EGERLVRVTEGGVDDVVPLSLSLDLRVGHAVAWAHGVVAIVAIGIDAVIALALEGAGFEPVLEPTPILERAGSHTRTARLAEHPDGFALVYGGWEPESHNGIYGRLLRCDGFD
ncbi:MAG TPA: hypothetical protein RMH99_16170, partial [Sandaracinaceae bacterium LLY-WYZ-13_1]|nr:hypothetical protein [Sandaracinaceae bacterium LLY-WYZ-13_1]